MKTTLILHVILMTVAMNNNMGFPNGTPLDHDAEDKFFAEFNGVCENIENLSIAAHNDLTFSLGEWRLLKKKLLCGEYAEEITDHVNRPRQCWPVLDKLATNERTTRKRVKKLCVVMIMYGDDTIGYRRSRDHPDRIYAFTYNYEWNQTDEYGNVTPPLKVLDLIKLSAGEVAPAAK